MLLAFRRRARGSWLLLSAGVVVGSCARADEPHGAAGGSVLDASVGDAQAGASGDAGAAGEGGTAGVGGQGGQGGAEVGGAGGSAAAGGLGGTGGYAGTGGTGWGGAAGATDAGIACGAQVCTNWTCEKPAIGLSMTVYGCCQQTNECGAVNEQGGNLCVPVEVVEQLLGLECKPD